MLYMIGTLAFDTKPFNVDAVTRKATADLAEKPVVSGLAPSEFMGDGGETLKLSGRLLPAVIGGLSELEIAHQMRRSGARVPVMRGDGFRLGTFAITAIEERHTHLLQGGVGFALDYTIDLKKVQEDRDGNLGVVQGLMSLFNALKG